MTVYAYLRVSTKGQTTDNQRIKIAELFSVDTWITEHAVSGSIRALERPEFSQLIEIVEAGDSVISVSLDRLGRDTEDVLHTIRKFHEKGVHLRLMDLDGVDLTSETGKLLVTMLSMVAEMERNKCITRTAAGVARAKEEGKVFGRYFKISPKHLAEMIEKKSQGATYDVLSTTYKQDRNTICQAIKKWKDNMEEYSATWDKQQEQKKAKAKGLKKF